MAPNSIQGHSDRNRLLRSVAARASALASQLTSQPLRIVIASILRDSTLPSDRGYKASDDAHQTESGGVCAIAARRVAAELMVTTTSPDVKLRNYDAQMEMCRAACS
jgi:hypothetical protein